MEKYLLKTVCPARYFLNPLLIWIELPVDVLKKQRCILKAGDKGRERLTSRINDRKFRRRAKGKSYYNTTLPNGWSMHVQNIPEFIPMERWDARYAHMLARRVPVLAKLRQRERDNYLKGAQPNTTTDGSDVSKSGAPKTTSTAPTKPKTSAQSRQPSLNTDQSQQSITDQHAHDNDDEDVTQMEDVD